MRRFIVAVTVAIGAALVWGCGSACKGNEGATLETACAAWNGGKYERLPHMCGIDPHLGSSTTSWSDGTGTCTCTITKQFPTMFYYVHDCTYAAGK